MMRTAMRLIQLSLALMALTICTGQGCSFGPPPSGGPGDSGNDTQPETLQLESFVTETQGASGLAIRPSDGALFAVNANGLFGPLQAGDRISQLTPIGATNLGVADLFGDSPTGMVLAITASGEFWIGSQCCGTLAVVPPAGGDAVAFEGLLNSSNIKPEAMAIVPSDFDGAQMHPGNLLVGQQTTFSRLAAVDVLGARTVVNVSNPGGLNREAHALAFGPGPVFYSGDELAASGIAGIQNIATSGAPIGVSGSENTGVHSMVVRGNGDIVFRGRHNTVGGDELNGVLVFSAADDTVKLGVGLLTSETSADDELVITADRTTIYLSLPARNEIVRVVDR